MIKLFSTDIPTNPLDDIAGRFVRFSLRVKGHCQNIIRSLIKPAADYQVRKWSGWHHHMALVFMAMLFMLEERLRAADVYPLLSCSDIEELLKQFLPRRAVTQEEVLAQMQKRHRKRFASIRAQYAKQGVELWE
jgi:hypothetical protein